MYLTFGIIRGSAPMHGENTQAHKLIHVRVHSPHTEFHIVLTKIVVWRIIKALD